MALPFLFLALMAHTMGFSPRAFISHKANPSSTMSTRASKLSMSVGDSAIMSEDDYIAVGLACCFRMDPDSGKLNEAWVYEPLTAGSLETIEKGIETSYRQVMALKLGDFFAGDVNSPTGVNMDNLEALGDGYDGVELCENVMERAAAASRTFRRREEAKMLELYEMSDEYNFSTERKRILNQVKVVSDDDNIKQDKSIDVYGRGGDDDDDNDNGLKDEIEKLANA